MEAPPVKSTAKTDAGVLNARPKKIDTVTTMTALPVGGAAGTL